MSETANVPDPVAEAMVRVEGRLVGKPSTGMALVPVDALVVLLSALREAREDGADLTFITGDLLLDVDACAMGTATETHYDVMARDLRKRITARLSAARTGDKG